MSGNWVASTLLDAAKSTFDDKLKELAFQQSGLTSANAIQNENLAYEPTYRAKPIPKLLHLSWEDRDFYDTAINGQYTNFGWRLSPDLFKGFNTITMVGATYNPEFFVNMGAYFVLAIQGVTTQTIYSTATAKGRMKITPTFMVPSQASLYQTTAGYDRFPVWVQQDAVRASAVSIRNLNPEEFNVSIGDENMERFTLTGSVPGSEFYCELLFLLE